MSATTFEKISAEIAGEFLQTVVVVDDGAYYKSKLTVPSAINEPGMLAAAKPDEAVTTSPEDKRKNLDAKELVDAFANLGLACAILVPENQEDAAREANFPAARNADILILDWKIGDNGNATKEIIKQIVNADAGSNEHLRLVIIYTDQLGLDVIIQEVRSAVAIECIVEKDQHGLTCGPTRIIAFNKGKSDGTSTVSESDLPEKVVSEFSKMTAGLVSNVVLNSLAAIRTNAHRLLLQFGRDLDAPYLTHRALTTPPEEADYHLIPLIVSELQAILEDANVTARLAPDIIASWLEYRIDKGLELNNRLNGTADMDIKACVLNLIRGGIKSFKTNDGSETFKDMVGSLKDHNSVGHRRAIDELTSVFCSMNISGTESNGKLAALMSSRHRYNSSNRKLILGTIIAEERNGDLRYWLCIQPRCDSVRLKRNTPHQFVFLKMTTASDSEGFSYIFDDGGHMAKLNVSYKPQDSAIITFKPASGKTDITAMKTDDQWWFSTRDSQETKYRWVTDLKTESAQRVANEYAAQLCRVGLTESEWLRRSAKKRDI